MCEVTRELENQYGTFAEQYAADPVKHDRWFKNYIDAKYTGDTWYDVERHMQAYGITYKEVLSSLCLIKWTGQWEFEN